METDSPEGMPRRLLVGPSVRLGMIRGTDVDQLVAWEEDGRSARLGDSGPSFPRPEATARSWWEKRLANTDSHHFAIRLRDEESTLVGTLCLGAIEWSNRVAELGIGIPDPAMWGHGYGTEATGLVVEFAFDDMNLHRVQLSVFAFNARAIASYERIGFRREGVFREYLERDGRRHDMILYGLLASEWRERRAH